MPCSSSVWDSLLGNRADKKYEVLFRVMSVGDARVVKKHNKIDGAIFKRFVRPSSAVKKYEASFSRLYRIIDDLFLFTVNEGYRRRLDSGAGE
jgi:hypothetical protein